MTKIPNLVAFMHSMIGLRGVHRRGRGGRTARLGHRQ